MDEAERAVNGCKCRDDNTLHHTQPLHHPQPVSDSAPAQGPTLDGSVMSVDGELRELGYLCAISERTRTIYYQVERLTALVDELTERVAALEGGRGGKAYRGGE